MLCKLEVRLLFLKHVLLLGFVFTSLVDCKGFTPWGSLEVCNRALISTGKQWRDPLTAVLSVSMTVPPNCPCLYRVSMSMMSFDDFITGRKCCAKLHCFLLVSCVYPVKSHEWLLFWETLIGQCRSYDLIQVPLQFSTGMSSSGGFLCI